MSNSKQQSLEEYYRQVDTLDPELFLPKLAEDVVVTLGNADPVVGRADVAAMFGGMLGVIRSCRHVLHAVHDLGGDLAACEGEMRIVRRDDKEVSVRFANFVRVGEDGVLHEQRLTMDAAPLFA